MAAQGIARALSVVVCLAFVTLIAVSCTRKSGDKDVDTGRAPDFTLRTLRGEPIGLSGLRGSVVVLEFWATWCPPCREAVPELNALYAKYRDRGVVILGISVDSGGEAPVPVDAFVKEHGILYPVVLDDGTVNPRYGVSSIPALFIIDREGKIAARHAGFLPGLAEHLSKEIDRLL